MTIDPFSPDSEESTKKTKNLSEEEDILKGDDERYISQSDANMRLAGTIVRFKGKPYFVKRVNPNRECVAWDMVGKSTDVRFSSNDKNLDVSSIPLGFINKAGTGFYISRLPLRAQKQGVDLMSCSVFSLTAGDYIGFNSSGDNLIAVRKMLESEYPSLEECVAHPSGSVSRTWGIRKLKDPSLNLTFHRDVPVAIFIPSEKRFIFTKKALTRPRYSSLMNVLLKKGKSGEQYHVEEAS